MLTVEYLLDLDIKHTTAIQTPTIMRGDTAVLKFRVHDRDSNEPLKRFDSAEVTLVMPSGITITEDCVKQTIDGVDIARFEFKKIHSIEVGLYQLYLTITQNGERVSVPPFPLAIDDNVSQSDYEFMEIITGLEDQLVELRDAINEGVSLDSINVADGVAGLDSMKKIPRALLLDYFDNHISTTMYKDGAHGFKLDETTKKPWVLVNGEWKEAKYSETPMGAGSPMPIPTIKVQNGYAIVTFIESVELSLRKWAFGIQNVTWFRTNGIVASTNTFPVEQVGDHTFYYKLKDGRENTVVFSVSAKDLESGLTKPIEEFNDGDIVKFANMEWIVLDSEKRYLLSRFSIGEYEFSKEDATKRFDPDEETSVAYYLNDSFLNSFAPSEAVKIEESQWMTGNDIQENSTSVSALIGMLSLSETVLYSSVLSQYPEWNDSSVLTKGFPTLTESSADSREIWRMTLQNEEWNASTIGKGSLMLIRPALYLLSGSLVEPVTKDEIIPLSDLSDGDIVKFSDKRWRILDKNQGLVIYDDIPIYRKMKNLWQDFLNSSFYLELSGQAKSFIQANDWDLSKVNDTPFSDRVTAYVGLLSVNMFNTYKDNLEFLKDTKMFWTSTRGQYSENFVAINSNSPDFGNRVDLSIELDYLILPVIKVSQDATFSKLKENKVQLSEVRKGEQVWLGNYPWVKANNNDLILNYNYRMDTEPRKVPFSGDDSSDYFSKAVDSNTIKNASTDINIKFLLSRLFNKVADTLTEKEFNIGFVSNPISTKGFFKVGMINTNTWNEDYRLKLDNLHIEEDFWLLNPQDADNACYVSAQDRQVKVASVMNIEKITKPLLRLDLTTEVQTYTKDEGNFAYIPDPIVRGQLNISLGKGSSTEPVYSQITPEEMQSITVFDTLDLGGATDLTGLELLTNCATINMRHNAQSEFKITDFTPVIKLGENQTLKRLDIYGVPEGDSSLNVYNQLKAKFPNLTGGGVYTNNRQKVLISLAELQGVPESVMINLQNVYTSSVTVNDATVTQFHSIRVTSNGKTPIAQVKPFGSDVYVDLDSPTWNLDSSSSSYGFNPDWAKAPTNYTSSETALYSIGFKTVDGKENMVYYKVDPNYGYMWEGNKKEPVLFQTKRTGDMQTTVTLPTAVDGLPVKQFGSRYEYPFWSQNNVVSVTIPVNYESIGGVFYRTDKLEHVYVYNDNVEYIEYNKRDSFGGKTGISPITTLHGRQNSTTQAYFNFKQEDWNTYKHKYTFALLS